jgi:hypothetical protein
MECVPVFKLKVIMGAHLVDQRKYKRKANQPSLKKLYTWGHEGFCMWATNYDSKHIINSSMVNQKCALPRKDHPVHFGRINGRG